MNEEQYRDLKIKFNKHKIEAQKPLKEIREQGQKEHKRVLDYLETMQLYYGFLGDYGYLKGEHEEIKIIITKIFHELGGVLACLRDGHIQASTHILRAIFELNLNVKYIYEDFGKNITLYSNYKYILQKDHSAGHGFSQNELNKIEQNYDAVKNDYYEYNNWFGKDLEITTNGRYKRSLKQLASYFNELNLYKTLYGTLSAIAHASSGTHFLVVSDAGYQTKPYYSEEINHWAYIALHCSYEILSSILKEQLEALQVATDIFSNFKEEFSL